MQRRFWFFYIAAWTPYALSYYVLFRFSQGIWRHFAKPHTTSLLRRLSVH